jgi:predicted  nucleic acid-binding Zn-ribbon protein
MKDYAIAAASSLFTLLVTFLVTRRKNKAETDLTEVKTVKEIVEIYREGFETIKEELKEARDEIAKLRQEVNKLTALNAELDCEVKALRKETQVNLK